MLLTEGYDNPAIDAVCVLRLTKVRALYCQMIGRGTRLSPGKQFLYVPDFLWNTDTHSLCRPAHLIAPSQEIAELMMKKQDAEPNAEDIEQGKLFGLTKEEISAAQREVIEQREKALAATLEEMRKKKAKLVDPVQFAASIADEDIMDYVPTFPQDAGPATDKQIAALEKAGILPDSVTCFGAASMILDKLAVRRLNGMASPKQIRCLERYGVRHAGECSYDDAQKAINRLAAHAWRKPWDKWTDAEGRLIK
jgi:type I site-specific restriction endonuclease